MKINIKVMYKIILGLFLSTILFAQSYAQVDDAKSRAILDKVSAKAKANKNMKFEFTYVMIDKKNNINDSLNGVIVMSGNKFNLDFMGRKIISDGKTVWQHDPDAEEIQISNVTNDQEAFNPGKLLTAYDKSFRTKLIKTITEKGKKYHIIDLYPKEGKAYYKIRLKIDAKELRVVEGTIFNKDNVTYKYIVNKFQPNVSVPANYYVMSTKDYPDADVVDLR
jgi:outer membrane lipoprotein carrier protein